MQICIKSFNSRIMFPFLQNMFTDVFFVALKWVWKLQPQIYSYWQQQYPPCVTSCRAPNIAVWELSRELIKYHWRGKAGPAFFPGSHCVLLSLGCHHTGAQSPPRLCGHQWPDNAPMCSSMCSKKAVYHKIGYKGPVWSPLSRPQYQCFYHQLTGS